MKEPQGRRRHSFSIGIGSPNLADGAAKAGVVARDVGRAPSMSRLCVLCASPMERVFEKHGFWIVDCCRCTHRSTEFEPAPGHVDEVYGDDYFEGGNAGYTDYLGEGEILRARGKRYGELLRRFHEGERVLDVGAAAGLVLAGLEDAGWHGVGIEPNPRMASYARETLGLDVRTGALEEYADAELFDAELFDAVTFIQVLPHFFNPRRALERALTATRSGGIWLIETWDRESWTAKALGKNWHEYSPPSVLHWFSRAGVVELASQYGMVLVDEGRPAKSLKGEHARSLLEHSARGSKFGALVRAAARVIPPRLEIPYPGDDLRWMIFRKK